MQASRLLGLVVVAVALLTPGRAPADEKADALLKEVKTATAAIQSLSAEIVLTTNVNGKESKSTITITLKRPNLMRSESSADSRFSDGKDYIQVTGDKQYTKFTADPQGKNLYPPMPLQGFFNPDRLFPIDYVSKYAEKETVAGAEYEVIEVTPPSRAAGPAPTTRLLVGADKLIHRATMTRKLAAGELKTEHVFRNLKTNVPLEDSVFAYTLPADAKPRPVVTGFGQVPGRVQADEKADALLKEVKAATASIQSLTAEIVVTSNRNGTESKSVTMVKLKRPNLMRAEFSDGRVFFSDGKDFIQVMTTNQPYQKYAADPQGKNLTPPQPFMGFFNAYLFPVDYAAKYAGKEIVEGAEYEIIEVTPPPRAPGGVPPSTTRFLVGVDKLIHRATLTIKLDNGESKTDCVLRNLKTNVPLEDSAFAADAKPTPVVLPPRVVPSGRADQKADALLKEVRAATAAIQSLTAEVVAIHTSNDRELKTEFTIKLKRPNRERTEYKSSNPSAGNISVRASDGKTVTTLLTNNQYMRYAVSEDGKTLRPPMPFHGFFDSEALVASGYIANYAGREKVDGVEYEVIEITSDPKAPPANVSMAQRTTRLFVGPDKLIRRTTIESKAATAAFRMEYMLRILNIGATINEDAFTLQLPADAKPFGSPGVRSSATPAAPRPPLVAVGESAPDFNLPTISGDKLALSDFVKGKKAVLINFWFLN